MIRSSLLAGTGAAMVLLGAAPLVAQPHGEREWRQIRVDASPFDLSEPSGIAALERRIDRAVNRICGSDRLCREEAWASTEEQVAWAIGRDRWLREMAGQRIAQLRACGRWECARRVGYVPQPPSPRMGPGSVSVTIVYAGAPAHYAAD
jgi:UrcA family protein